MLPNPEDVLNFWFYEVGRERWFVADPKLDVRIKEKFLPLHEIAAGGELKSWEDTPEGVLALLLLLDQFPRNMFRGTARTYATDELALDLARSAIIKHFDDRIDRQFKLFFYLPFEHSESVGDQRLALFYIRERTKEEDWLTYAENHLYVIQRFGRFPHRNPILGREHTKEEMEYLNQGSALMLA